MRIITILLLFNIVIYYAQDRPMEDYSIAKRVDISNNYNTGQPNVQLPIYNFEYSGINLSSSLIYQNDMISGEPSIVGTNWGVNLFGKIILQDSNNYLNPILYKQNNGFYQNNYNICMIKNIEPLPTKKQMLDNPNTHIKKYSPNKFYFEFLGYSGTFLADNLGNILVQSESNDLKVTFNGQRCYNIYSQIGNSVPEIIMEDSKGNKFYFGGDYNSVEVNYQKNKYQYSNMNFNGGSTDYTAYRNINYYNAFYLKKVELNNGRSIIAYYKNSNKSVIENFTNGGYYFGTDYSYVLPTKNTLLMNNLFIGKDIINNFDSVNFWNTSTTTGFSSNTTETYYKIPLLDSIEINDLGSLHFSYQQINNALTKPFLKNIIVKNQNKIINNIDFFYKNIDGRIFLDKYLHNQKEYSFEYFDYYNNQNKAASVGGLLKKVSYPTKGYNSIEYERNMASKITSINSNYEQTITEIQDVEVPGFRLKSLKMYPSNIENNFIERKYYYKNSNGKSSGITSTGKIYPIGSTTDPMAMFGNNGGYYESLYSSNVSYSKVTEEISGKEKTEFFFTDLTTNPDSLNINSYASYSQNVINHNPKLYISKYIERGKLYLTKKYNSDNKLVFEESIKYRNFLNNANSKKEISPDCTDCKISDYRYYIRANQSIDPLDPQKYSGYYTVQPVLPYLPSKIVTKKLATDNLTYFESTQDIEYNDKYLYWHSNPVKITTNTNGRINSVYNYYPGDLLKTGGCYTTNCNFTNIANTGRKMLTYKQMTVDNINYPILTLNKNSFGKFSALENIYEKVGASNKYILISQKKSTLSSIFNDSNFENAEVFEIINYQLYDDKQNLIQYKSESNLPVTTLYGYNQTLPIAKIEGATYMEVMSALNLGADPTDYLSSQIYLKSNADTNDTTEGELISELDAFRKLTALTNTKITTYTYDPLVGITSITSPSGIREVYLYDSANRLKEIRENSSTGKVIKEFKYNYAPFIYYNSAKSQSFVKNDCSYGWLGNLFMYSVPAGTYMSLVSQADADQMAQNDINTNGQNLANSNVSCYENLCNVTQTYYTTINYSSVHEVTPGHFKAIVSLVIPNLNGLGQNWTDGVIIGDIAQSCRPNGYKYINVNSNNRPWTILMNAGGQIGLKLNSGSVNPGDSYTFYFEYDKN